MIYDVIIVGAGLAGCSAAINLARKGASVLLLEKRAHADHKLCGEFLSVETSAAFAKLGVLDAIHAAGAAAIDTMALTTARGAVFRARLPGVALGLSRRVLDQILFDAARAAGADGRLAATVSEIKGGFAEGFRVVSAAGAFEGRMVFAAYGKRSSLDTRLARKFLNAPAPYVAYKQHYECPSFPARIEVHGFDGGYCGVSPIEDGRVNMCFIAHERVLHAANGSLPEMLASALKSNPRLAARLDSMPAVPGTLRAVSHPSLAGKSKFEGDICMIGDAAGMIAPLCGDGMAMALRTAELVTPLARAYLRGRLPAEAFKRACISRWNREFAARIQIGRFIHERGLNPAFADYAIGLCARHPRLGEWMIAKTRGTEGSDL